MGKKRAKSRTTKQLESQIVPREGAANELLNDDMISAAISSISHGVLMKVCRLCETKDGPFLNIFDADKVTAKKIDEVMPFGIAENDDLPHKICFRCSAKVEELYEFIQKCIKTQESLRTTMGKKGPLITKTKTRALWEEKLNKTNLSNDDICNALIKKAMEGIKDMPLSPLPVEKEKPLPTTNKKLKSNTESLVTSKKDKEPAAMSSKTNITYQSDEDEPDEISLKQVKLSIEKCDDKAPLTRSSRANKSESLPEKLTESPRKNPSRKSQNKLELTSLDNKLTKDIRQSENQKSNSASDDKSKDKSDQEKPKEVPANVVAPPPPPPINIMDHVSTIKVNGVGTLFLCKLCNRNFLKKEVVMTHGCAKNNVPKDSFLQNHTPPPDVPKPSTVKYIKMDKDFKKPVTENKPAEKKSVTPDCIRVNIPVQPVAKNKPKSGPAGKLKPPEPVAEIPKEPTPPLVPIAKPKTAQEDKPVIPSLQFPGLPSLNSRYKLVPGPNNTFTLVEDAVPQNEEKPVENNTSPAEPLTKGKKRKMNSATPNASTSLLRVTEKEPSPEVIDLDDNIPPQPPPVVEQPYPVGLFQTVPHHSGVFAPNTQPQPAAFTTPAMKKQSYTIVQTGNPSKLLISTKPQPVNEEQPRKKSRKSKPEVRETSKEPYNVTLEENAPPKEAGFFTFINVDPLLQPSYVLPTNNIIQESQITTSTPVSKSILENKDKDKYSCNMCNEKFSREKKLLSHIQSHYKQMDEEDQLRAEKTVTKRKSRRS